MNLQQPQAFAPGSPVAAYPAPLPSAPPTYPLPDDSLPLPDHFPAPYVDPDTESRSSRTSVVLETGATLVYCAPPPQVAPPNGEVTTNGSVSVDEAKEGIRRITDKYAAPETLLRNSSCSVSRDSFGRQSTSSFGGCAPPVQLVYRSESPVQSLRPTSSSTIPSIDTPPLPASPTVPSPNPDSQPDGMSRLHVSEATGSRGSLQGLGSPTFSDASSDISDVPPWAANEAANSPPGSRIQPNLAEGVTDQDVQQVEMFYKSHKSDVIVCHSLANLYFGSAVASGSSPSPAQPSSSPVPASGSETWEFMNTGIPVLVLDTGRHHRTRQLSVVLAEKGTGFVLWRDVVSHLTRYNCPHANFHTLRVSADNNKLAGLSFDDSKAAADFAATFKQMTSDPDDDLLMLSKKGKKKKKKQESKKVKYKPPKKTDISQPCCFQHVTKLERPQIGAVLPPPPNGFPPSATSSSMSSLSDVFHDRLALSASRARSQSSELTLGSSARSDQ